MIGNMICCAERNWGSENVEFLQFELGLWSEGLCCSTSFFFVSQKWTSVSLEYEMLWNYVILN